MSLDAGTVFNLPNPISATAFAKRSQLFFVGSDASSTGDAAAFAVAVAGPGSTVFAGITPQTIFIQDVEQPNPLYGAQINFLTATGRQGISPTDNVPAVTIQSDPNHVYVITSYVQTSNPALVISQQLLDANNQPVSGIDALVGSVQGSIYAAVSPQGGDFGDNGGGISFCNLTVQQNSPIFSLPAPINKTTPLAIGSPLVWLSSPTLYVSSYRQTAALDEKDIGTLFAGFNVIGGPNTTDGAVAVAYSLNEVGANSLLLAPIVSAGAVSTDSIVAGIGANTMVWIHFLATVFPSVGTQYLIVVGGVGEENVEPINVYALPITSNGSLASINAQPTIGLYNQRQFTVAAAQPGDLYTSSSVPAIVGGGSAPGTITSLYTAGDSVIITVNDSTDQAPGIFYSQAIFNNNAVICGWTNWQRAVVTQGTPASAVYDRINTQFWYSTELTSTVQSVVSTAWDENGTPLAQLLLNTLPQAQAGIQGVTDVLATMPFFSQTPGYRSSAALFTGLNTVILAETAQDVGVTLTPVIAYPDTFASTDGTLNAYSAPAAYISMTGGILDSLQAIIASAIVSCGGNSWIVVGGNGGLAVLAMPDGTGIPDGSISQNFTGLSQQLIWQTLGNYTNVRKLVSQNGSLYVLTDTLFERVRITPELITQTIPFTSTNLATAQTLSNGLYYLFSDVIVSEPLVILATSSGLLRSGNGASVATAASQSEMNWQVVTMPESTGCATRLWAITQTGSETDLYLAPPAVSGNLYVLSGNVSRDQARMYRYVINYDAAGVNDGTVQLFNDFFVVNRPTFFVNVGAYRNFFYSDGMLLTMSRSRYLLEKPFVQALPDELKQGFRVRVPQNTGFFSDANANAIGQVERLSGLGSWVIPGNFGLVVHH